MMKWHLFLTFRDPAVNTITAQIPGKGQRLGQRELCKLQMNSYLGILHIPKLTVHDFKLLSSKDNLER